MTKNNKNKTHLTTPYALFYGSSFTWGNGLWLFDFDGFHKPYFERQDWNWKSITCARNDIFDSDLKLDFSNDDNEKYTITGINTEARKFMYDNRWSKLVSNYYGMEELNNAQGHGLIGKTVSLMSEVQSWKDIGLLSIEFFGVARFQEGPSPEDGGEELGPLTPKEMEIYIKENPNTHYSYILRDWIINFDYDFQLKTQLQKLEEQLEKISKFNIPTVIHFWQEDDIQEMKKLISEYPLVYKYTINKEVAILDWADGKYKIHDEHPHYNKSIGAEDLHLGKKGHTEFSKKIIKYIGDKNDI